MHKKIAVIIPTLLLALVLLSSLASPAAGSSTEELYENLAGPYDSFGPIDQTQITGQSFTPEVTHNVSAAAIWLSSGSESASPLNITVEIKATDSDGKPTGPALASATVDCQSSWGGNFYQKFQFAPPFATVEAGIIYAIVVSADVPNLNVIKTTQNTANPYSNGNFLVSGNGGSSWLNITDTDMPFEIYGEPLLPPELLWEGNTGHDITDLAVGRWNGDNKDDVAAIDHPEPDTLNVFDGAGDGSGNENSLFSDPISGYAVAMGNIDGDAASEVVANDYGTGIVAYETDGSVKWTYPTPWVVKDIEIADLDGDTYGDVIACNVDSLPSAVYAIDGQTGVDMPGWPKQYDGESFLDVAVGAKDNTGAMIVAAIGTGVSGSLYVFDSAGAEQWHNQIQGRTVEIGDVDGDGTAEVVAGGYLAVAADLSATIDLEENTKEDVGTPSGRLFAFAAADGCQKYFYNTYSQVTDIELGDLDGVPANGVEAAYISSGGKTLCALDIDQPVDKLMWYYDMSWNTSYYGESLGIGDVDRDYKNEVVACSSIAVHRVYAFDGLDNNGDGVGDMVWSPFDVTTDLFDKQITDLELGDFDGDGDKDVVFGTVSQTLEQEPVGGFDGFSSNIYVIAAFERSIVSATNTSPVYFDADPSTLEDIQPVAENTLPTQGKPNYSFPHGFFSFNVTGLNPGQTATITVTLPSAAPVGTKWVKCQDDVWSELPIGSDDGDNIITFDVTDGGAGDADGVQDGRVVEPGGPGYPRGPRPVLMGVGGEVGGVNKLAVSGPWIALLLAAVAGGALLAARRRKTQ